ncbi:MAG: hypothetical protein ACPGR8_06395 [Limisphaerales bacterium]
MDYLVKIQYTAHRRTLYTLDVYAFIAIIVTFWWLQLNPYVIALVFVLLAFRLLLEQRSLHKIEDAMDVPRTQLILT